MLKISMLSLGIGVRAVIGTGLIATSSWVLLAPLFGSTNPPIEMVTMAVPSGLLGCYLVGRAIHIVLVENAQSRPSVPECDQTMDWITRP